VDFTFTDEQLELKRSARDWLAERYPLDRDWDGLQDDRWAELAELGWLDVAEAGLGFVEEAILLEELGYALYPGPYLALVAGQNGVIELNGLAYGGDHGEPIDSVDPTRPLRRVGPGNGSKETPRLRVAMAADALGVAQRALELGIQHAKTREQFGRPIGVYQAVSHALADTYTDVELSRSLVYWAAWCVAEEDEQAPIAAAAANAFATEAAVAACERSIQVHGGTGFTWEHPLHRFYKRALWLEGFGQRPSALRREIANAVLGVTVPV
jgi:alkylation response protein AidB-like acyl-CoA dehydrogenase